MCLSDGEPHGRGLALPECPCTLTSEGQQAGSHPSSPVRAWLCGACTPLPRLPPTSSRCLAVSSLVLPCRWQVSTCLAQPSPPQNDGGQGGLPIPSPRRAWPLGGNLGSRWSCGGPPVVVSTSDFPYLSDLGFLMTVKMKLVRRCELTASCGREGVTSRPSPRCPQIQTKEPSWLTRVSRDSGGPSRLFLPSRSTHPTVGQSPLTALSPLGASPPSPSDTPALPRRSSECIALPSPRSLWREVQDREALGPWVGSSLGRTPAIRQWDPGGWMWVHGALVGPGI